MFKLSWLTRYEQPIFNEPYFILFFTVINGYKYITSGFQDGEQFSQIGLKFIHSLFCTEKQQLITYHNEM